MEETTARGGDLLNRTVESFKAGQSRDTHAHGQESEGSDEEIGNTPKAAKLDVDEPGSGERRSRGELKYYRRKHAKLICLP